MPISFYHGFEAAEPATRASYSDQIQKLLEYLDSLERADADGSGTQHVALRLETRLCRGGKDETALPFRWTDDPNTPALAIREEDVLKNYPLTYRDLTDTLKRRYDNFLENDDYHRLRKKFEQDKKYSILRILHPTNPKSSRQRFYNSNILQEFDKHYKRRTKNAESRDQVKVPELAK
jgi:hypothetical protein